MTTLPRHRPRKSKHWCFTINNYTSDDIPVSDQIQYIILGKEVAPDTGTPHYQGYVVFKTQLRMTQVSKIMPRASLGIKYTKSTPQ